MSNALVTLSNKLAERFGLGGETEVMDILKSTAFKGAVSDAQMTALLVVANQYGLNPWTKEIYAFPDRNNGIVPVVGVDGWSRIINEHPQFDGMDFDVSDEQATCTIHRKDRGHPTTITEYMAECRRDVAPWKSHPRRMLRHKAMIQCARLAFGFVGIYEQDEAERIADSTVIDGTTGEVLPPVAKPYAGPTKPRVSAEERELLGRIAAGLQKSYQAEGAIRAAQRLIDSALDMDQEMAVWEMFSGDQHSAMRNDVKQAMRQLRNPDQQEPQQ